MNLRALAAVAGVAILAAGAVVLVDDKEAPIEIEPVETLKTKWDERVTAFKVLAKDDKEAPTAVLLDDKRDATCWKTKTGCCRYGLRGCEPTESGLNGLACDYSFVTGPLPCVVDTGAGSAMTRAAEVWEPKE